MDEEERIQRTTEDYGKKEDEHSFASISSSVDLNDSAPTREERKCL